MSGVATLFNVIVQWGGTSDTPTWVTFPGVVSHQEPGATPADIDVSSYDNTTRWPSFVNGMMQGEPMNITGNYIPGNTVLEAVRAAAYTGALGHVRLLLDDLAAPSAATDATAAAILVTFRGKVGWNASGELAGKQTYTATIRPNSAVTAAAPA